MPWIVIRCVSKKRPPFCCWNNSVKTLVSRYQKKHSPIHTYRGHGSSLICFLHPLQSMQSCLFNSHAWQSFSTISLQVFFGLPLGLAPSTLAWHPQLHTAYISSPNHCLVFTAHSHTIAACFAVVPRLSSNPSLSLNLLLGTLLSCSLMPHMHLTILISARWSSTSFSFLMGQVSLRYNILLCTQLLYSLPLTINDISFLVSSGTNCLNLFHPIWISVSTVIIIMLLVKLFG